ncbi:MAG TPA: class C beta-lactamase [Candidatus Baltobacteraceae bacterium]
MILALTLAASISHAVDATVKPLMAKNSIPGMAVGVVAGGKPFFFYYGLASKQTGQPISARTLFELGSISKTFTATLASYAGQRGFISLSDKVEKYLPALRGTQFGGATLLNLGTHTAGVLPLQVPDGVDNDDQLVAYLKGFRSPKTPGTVRVYNNVSIGTLGLIVAKSMHEDFASLMDRRLFPELGLEHTYIDVPPAKMADYAEGYRTNGTPVRMTPGELWPEAYGVRTTAPDLTRFLRIQMGAIEVDPLVARAISATHTGYFRAGPMTQDLIWEQYPWPVALSALLEGTDMIEDVVPVRRLNPPLSPQPDVWLNKTGSTNGFAAYVAFVPSKHMGIVLLANKSYPLNERVKAAFDILSKL